MTADLSPRRLILGLAAIWALAAAILLFVARDRIAPLTMWDPDDYLRLQQVRDWLGGQSFFDVTQYRIDPPHGVPMHWSRIVDLPIAGLILLLQPLFGTPLAERIAACAVPLVTLAGVLCAVALTTLRLASARAALLAAALAATAPMMLFHLLPLRIDHHGWQTMLGLFTVAACFDRKPFRGGIAGGITAALWLAISLEALPMAAAITIILAIRCLLWGEEARLRAFTAALGIAGIALFAVFHGRAAWNEPWCDAMGPGWFGPLVASPILAAIGLRLTVARGPLARLAALALAGAIGVAILAATAPACLAGPFGTLDPVTRHLWYDNVLEGMPVWKQPAGNAALLVGFPIVGLIGTLLAWRSARTAAEARNWLTMLAILCGAFAVALMVQRAGGFAHGCALPGTGWLLARLLAAIAGWRRAPLRVLASTGAILALSPAGAMAAGTLVADAAQPTGATSGAPRKARSEPGDDLATIARLPRGTILAGIDLAPPLLIATPHSVAAGGYHRDPQAIRRVIDAFTSPPEAARAMMAAHLIDYVLIDPTGGEAQIYVGAAPDGLMARLTSGRVPAWLEPVPLGSAGSAHRSQFRLWRRIG